MLVSLENLVCGLSFYQITDLSLSLMKSSHELQLYVASQVPNLSTQHNVMHIQWFCAIHASSPDSLTLDKICVVQHNPNLK